MVAEGPRANLGCAGGWIPFETVPAGRSPSAEGRRSSATGNTVVGRRERRMVGILNWGDGWS